MNTHNPPLRPGDPGAPPLSYQDIIRGDGEQRPASIEESASFDLGTGDIGKSRYFSRSWHDREIRHMWPRVWQFACREEDLAEPGDHLVYDLADYSFIVTRGEDGRIRAFYNSCLHRGTQLRPSGSAGNASRFRCPFHGWTWNLDGSLAEIPCRWDFPKVTDEAYRLPEVKTGVWGGFVFVNMDPDCVPLEDYLGILPAHFAPWQFEKRRKVAHVAKVVPCNWKLALEAFMEGYHVPETHPQACDYTGDTNCQYDLWGPNVSRMMSALATPSPQLPEGSVGEQAIADAMRGFIVGDVGDLTIPPGGTARQVLGQAMRRMLTDATGVDHSDYSIAEILDAHQYFAFPNFMPWAGYGVPIVYRFRPNGHDPESSIMEVILLYVMPEGAQADPVDVHWLRPEDSWTAAPELGGLGALFDQDTSNMLAVQRGLSVPNGKPGVTLSRYQESRVRHYLETLDSYIGVADDEVAGRPCP